MFGLTISSLTKRTSGSKKESRPLGALSQGYKLKMIYSL
jgi:hypothetical protein